MEYLKVEVECPKELHELLEGVVGLLNSVNEARADGWDWATDAPTVVLQNLSQLSTALEGADKLKGEVEGDPAAAVRAGGLFVAQFLDALKKEDEAPAEEPTA